MKSQSPGTENNTETVPPLTLHQTIDLNLQVPLGPSFPALPYTTGFQISAGRAWCPLNDCTKQAPLRFPATCCSSLEGIHCNQDKSILLSAFKSLPLSFLLLQQLQTRLTLGSPWPQPVGGSTWQIFGVKKSLANSRRWLIISSVSTTIPPEAHNLMQTFIKPLHSK